MRSDELKASRLSFITPHCRIHLFFSCPSLFNFPSSPDNSGGCVPARSRPRFCSPAHVVAREARAPAAFAEEGDAAVEGERRVVWASDAVGVARGRGDVEDDA